MKVAGKLPGRWLGMLGLGLATALTAGMATASVSGATPVTVLTVQLVVGVASGPRASSVMASPPGQTTVLPGNRYLLNVPQGEVEATVSRLQSSSGVSYVSAVHTVHADAVPND